VSKGRSTEETIHVFRLYVVGRAPNSVQAINNLREICQTYLDGHYQIELIDIFEEPLRAVEDGILATPTLVRVSPQPEVKIVGNLSERKKVLAMLDLEKFD
jgi:circadian clock protein KaiB